jgi:transposase
MRHKRSYTTVDVERFEVAALVPMLTVGCIVAIDVAKTKFVAAIATADGDVLKLIRFEHPRQTPLFLRVLSTIAEAERQPKVVMEPTGTYGDAVRYQCHQLGLAVHMMPPKHTHDFAEILDGVPSMHDPKAAVVLAKLQAIKPARAWQPDSDARRDLRAWVDLRRPITRTLGLYHGHLESMLARHWPEIGAHVDVYQCRSWLALMKELPGPGAITAARERAAEVLRKASRGQLSSERVAAIVDSAPRTTGVPMTTGEVERLHAIVEQIAEQTERLGAVDAKLREFVERDPVLAQMATAVGPACASAIGALVGSPLAFSNAHSFEKAMGLNLKEKSSGNVEGKLGITKRGPGQVRQLLYLAALRMVKDDPTTAAWYRARKSHKAGQSLKAVVAVTRKLARALWHVARGAAFEPSKLFDTRRLDLTSARVTTTKKVVATSHTAMSTTTCQGGAALA